MGAQGVLPAAANGAAVTYKRARLSVRSRLSSSGTLLRGFNAASVRSPALVEADYRAVAAYGANLLRIAVTPTLNVSGTAFELSAADVAYVSTAVLMGNRYSFKVVVVMAPLPGGQLDTYWDRADLKASLVGIWASLATIFKGNRSIAGYDLLNEPVQPKDRDVPVGSAEYWRPLATDMITAIRAVDPMATCIFEPSPYGLPVGFWPSGVPLVPLPFANVVYSVHFYEPQNVTHQGINGNPAPVSYPSGIYTKQLLSDYAEYVRLFTRAYPTQRVYVGEFSFIRSGSGDSVPTWLADAIDIFESEGWHWTYHAFREYEGWDAEIELGPLGSPGPRTSSATGIKTLVKNGFSKKVQP